MFKIYKNELKHTRFISTIVLLSTKTDADTSNRRPFYFIILVIFMFYVQLFHNIVLLILFLLMKYCLLHTLQIYRARLVNYHNL